MEFLSGLILLVLALLVALEAFLVWQILLLSKNGEVVEHLAQMGYTLEAISSSVEKSIEVVSNLELRQDSTGGLIQDLSR